MTVARLILICGLPGAGKTTLAKELLGLDQSVILENGFWAREERDELRLTARRLDVPVELHALTAPVEELWRRVDLRNRRAEPGTVPIRREDLERWALQFEPPTPAELALFDPAPARRRVTPG